MPSGNKNKPLSLGNVYNAECAKENFPIQYTSIIIGKCKFVLNERGVITRHGIEIAIPAASKNYPKQNVNIAIKREDIVGIQVYFHPSKAILSIICTSDLFEQIWKSSGDNQYGLHTNDQRITLILTTFSHDMKRGLFKYFGDIIEQVDSNMADRILYIGEATSSKNIPAAGRKQETAVEGSWAQVFQTQQRHKLFHNFEIALHGDFGAGIKTGDHNPSKSDLWQLLTACGATVYRSVNLFTFGRGITGICIVDRSKSSTPTSKRVSTKV